MAFDAGDIEKIRARVPANHQPPQAAGLLSNVFSSVDSRGESTALQGNETGAVDRAAHASEQQRFHLGMGLIDDPHAAAPGFILPGALATLLADRTEKKEREEREEAEFAIDQMRRALDERLAKLNAELVAIDRRLDDIRARRAQIGEDMEALDELSRLERTGQLDPNNPAHARLLRRAGIKPEEARDNLAALIAQRRQALNDEDDGLEQEANANMKRRAQVIRERDAVQEAKNEITQADSAEARMLAERRAATALGAQQLGEAAYQSGSHHAKMVASDAVGGSAKSEASNRRVAAQTDEFFAKSDDSGWDDTPATKSRPPLPG